MDDVLPSIVSMRQVSKAYGASQVLQCVDLDVAAAERVSIIGPSGSGKTTLLRLLMALDVPDQGEIVVAGTPIWTRTKSGRLSASSKHLRAIRSNVGMVFQHFNLFPHMSALKNVIEAPIRVRAMPKPEAEALGRELLGQVGLAKEADRYPSQLSGGQRQRVAIARALAMQPNVMLFDEITSALDIELVGEVLGVVRRLAHGSQMTLIIVTHEMNFARDVSDRIVFMDAGQIVEQGPPAEIFGAPQHERTQRFLQAVRER